MMEQHGMRELRQQRLELVIMFKGFQVSALCCVLAWLVSTFIIVFEWHGLQSMSTSIDKDYSTESLLVSPALRGHQASEFHASMERNSPWFPTPPQVLHRKCLATKFDSAMFPSVSLIIPYLNETWPHVKATVGSLLANSPLDLISEILFVDDANLQEWQFHQELKSLHPKIQVHRNENRQGLIRSKAIGASMARGEVLIFMEPHCIVLPRWIEPLLSQVMISDNHSIIAVPVIDIIPENHFNHYHKASTRTGGFDWSLTFHWTDAPEHRNSLYRHPEAYPTPALSGGIFAIWHDFWELIGTYDMNMTEWGGENIEMSLRTWCCGGRIEIVPCSRLGHVFRAQHPYIVHGVEVYRNTKRAALVWLDEYLEEFYRMRPAARDLDAGDVQDRKQLKNRLACKSMNWYVDNVYPELRGKQPRRGWLSWLAQTFYLTVDSIVDLV